MPRHPTFANPLIVLLFCTCPLMIQGCASSGLQRAVQDGDLGGLQKITQKNAPAGNDLNGTDRTGRTLLSHAAERGHVAIIQELIALGADVDSRDIAPGESVNAQQTWQRLAWKTRNLLDADLRRQGARTLYMTPLAVAAAHGQPDAAEILLEQGADIESANGMDGNTPLLIAARSGQRAMADLLLARGADPLARNDDKQTALSLLAAHAHDDGDNADPLGTALSLLTAVHPPRQTKAVFTRYLDNLAENGDYLAALHGASANNNVELIKLLLDMGANPDLATDDGQSALALAAARGHLEAAGHLLAGGANPNGTGDIHVPLHDAVRHQHPAMVDKLLADKAKPDVLVQPGTTPLLTAIALNREDMIESLLNAGAKPDFTGPHGNTPLAAAVAQHKVSIVQRLLAARANPNVPWREGEEQASLIVLTVQRNQAETTELLLNAGALPDLTLPEDNTALFYAVAAQQEQQVVALLEAGADPNHLQSRGEVSLALQEAVRLQHLGMTRQLLDAGASPNPGQMKQAKDIRGAPPLQTAVLHPHSTLVLPLLEHGADPNIQWQHEQHLLTPLLVTIDREEKELTRALLAMGADPNLGQLAPLRFTALHRADALNDSALVRDLLAAGAKPDARDRDGRTALRHAALAGRTENVNALLAHKADLNLPDTQGFTPLYAAIQNKHLDIVRTLLAAGANPDLASQNQWTPLHKAAADDYMAGFHALLAAGADRTLKNRDGRTADDIIRIRVEEEARKRAEEERQRIAAEAERRRKEQARAQFMAGLYQAMQDVNNDLSQRNAQSQYDFQQSLARAQAQGEAERRAREAREAEAAARAHQQHLQQQAAYQQAAADARQRAEMEQAARQAEQARQRAAAQARAAQQEAERQRRIAEQEREARMNAQRVMQNFAIASQRQQELASSPPAQKQEIREYNAGYRSLDAAAWCYQYPESDRARAGKFICDGPLQRLMTSYSDFQAALRMVACSGAGAFAQPPPPGESRRYGCGYQLGGAHNRVMPDISPFP